MAALQIVVVGVDVLRRRRLDRLLLLRQQPHLELLDDRLGDLVLDGEDVGQVAVIAVGPEMRSVCAVDELRVDAHPLARLADASFQHVRDVEPPAHLLDVGVLCPCR